MSDIKKGKRTHNDALQEQINVRKRDEKARERRAEFKVIQGGGTPPSRIEVTVHAGAEVNLADIVKREERRMLLSHRETRST